MAPGGAAAPGPRPLRQTVTVLDSPAGGERQQWTAVIMRPPVRGPNSACNVLNDSSDAASRVLEIALLGGAPASN